MRLAATAGAFGAGWSRDHDDGNMRKVDESQVDVGRSRCVPRARPMRWIRFVGICRRNELDRICLSGKQGLNSPAPSQIRKKGARHSSLLPPQCPHYAESQFSCMKVIQQTKVTAHAQVLFEALCSVPSDPRSHPASAPGSLQRELSSFGIIWIAYLAMSASASKHGGRQRSMGLRRSFSTSTKQESLFTEDWAHCTKWHMTSAITRQCSRTTFDSAISSWRAAAT